MLNKIYNFGRFASLGALMGALLGAVLTASVFADEIALRPDHPNRYVVVKGDTLWDISARFLESPWRWPEVWSFNPQIENPHLIYPGDVVALVYDESGKPMLKVERGQATVKFSPKVRATRVDKPISSIPLDAISQFLGKPRIVTKREINNAAYVVAGTEDRIIAGEGDIVYVRGIVSGGDTEFSVLRIGDPYRNPGARRGDILGYEALNVADAKVIAFGDPATVRITQANREVLLGDRLVPKRDYGLDETFIPHAPQSAVEGQIISVIDGVSVIGQYQTVVINRGEQDGVETGHVLAVYQTGKTVRDVRDLTSSGTVTLPDTRAGILMVIRTFDRVSYALVMEAERDMRIHDFVRNPS
jgi:hypothetical protein